MSLLRLGSTGPLLRLANGGFISTSTTPPVQTIAGVVATLAAASITQTGLTLQWTASSGSTPISYAIYQKLHSGTNYANVGSTTNISFPITGLQAGTQYDYYVVASNSAGTAANGNVISPTTLAPVITPPSNVDTLTIVSASATTMALSWIAPAGTQPLTYTPQYKLHSASTWTSAATTTATSATITGLTPGTQYDARVLAGNSAGTTTSGATQTATTSNAQGVAPPPLSDFTFTQPSPLHPEMGGASFYVGWCDPVGGIGPFKWTTGSFDPYFMPDNRDAVVCYYSAVGSATDTFSVTCTDGRGDAITKLISITKTDGSAPVFQMNHRNPANNNFIDYSDAYFNGPFFTPQACGGAWSGNNTISDVIDMNTGVTSTAWHFDAGAGVSITNPPTVVPGAYPLRVVMHDSTGTLTHNVDFTANIQAYQNPSFIEFNFSPVSTATQPGLVIGKALATTPNNRAVWSLSDSTNTFAISANTGVVTVRNTPASTTPIVINITVTDHLSTYTQAFTITPAAGTVLPSTNITFAANSSLNNHTAGQTIGTASVTGMTGTKQWKLVDWSERNETNGYTVYGGQLLFSVDASGVVTQVNVSNSSFCAAQTYSMTLQVTDGVNSCTRTVSFNVAPPTTTTTYHVGRGMASAHPGLGFDTWNAFVDSGTGQTLHDDKKVVMIHADADPEYYANQSGTAYYGWYGPMRFEGVSLSDGTQARLGGPSSGMLAGPQHPRYGGSPNRLDNGDWEIINLEFSGYHKEASFYNGGVPAIFRNGTYGNLLVQNCRFRDNDMAIDSVISQGKLTVDHCEFMQTSSGVYFSGAGLAHGIYDGGTSLFTFTNNYMGTNCSGHQLKCRARKSVITGNRFIEGLVGGAANQIEFSNAGDHYIANNVIQKGTQPTNEAVIRYGMEGYGMEVNNLVIENNVISHLCQPGGQRFGPVIILEFRSDVSPFDATARATATVQNNQIYLPSVGFATWRAWDNQDGGNEYTTGPLIPVWTNNTALTIPPATDFTRPFLSGTVPTPHNFRWHSQVDANTYPNYDNVCQIVDKHELRVAHTASTGTVLCTMSATTDGKSLEFGVLQQFDTTTTWAIDPLNSMADTTLNPNPWAPTSRYTVTTNSNGTGTLKVGTGMPSGAQVDYVQVTATCGSAKSTQRYAIIVT